MHRINEALVGRIVIEAVKISAAIFACRACYIWGKRVGSRNAASGTVL